MDPDLGDAGDDYIGSDSTRSLAFVYNGREEDEVYGDPPPAVGYDFLTGAASHVYFIGNGPPGTGDPYTAEMYYNYLRGTWGNGTEITADGLGYQTYGEVTTWAFSGDPEAEEFWSEINLDGEGTNNFAGERRHAISSVPFTIPPGGSHTVDFAILFAVGADNLNSVTALKAASDEVQARYDAGALFVPFPAPPSPGSLAAPALLTPADGAMIVDEPVPFSWTPVDGAIHYRIEVADAPDFQNITTARIAFDADRAVDLNITPNRTVERFWRVRAVGPFAQSPFSASGHFTVRENDFSGFALGDAIVETASPGVDVCPPGTDDIGCGLYGGNTVWLDPNANADYVVTTPDNDIGEIDPPLRRRWRGRLRDALHRRLRHARLLPRRLRRRRARLRRRRDRERALRAVERGGRRARQ